MTLVINSSTRHPRGATKLTGESLRPVGMLLLVVGAGAFFGKVISATGIGTALADTMAAAGLPIIVLAYIISCALRLAQGSATVAIVTTGGIGPTGCRAGLFGSGHGIDRHVHRGRFHHRQPRQRRRILDHVEVLQPHRQADAATWTVLETILSVVSFTVAGTLFAIIA